MSKIIIVFSIILILFVNCLVGQTVQSKSIKNKSSIEPKLKLTTEVINSEYCSNSVLNLTMRFTFKNVGETPIILDKDSGYIHQWKIKKISNNDKNFKELTAKILSPLDAIFINELPEENMFVVLKKGESFSREDMNVLIDVYDYEESDPDLEGELLEGIYTIKFLTWNSFHFPSIINEYKSKWKNKGFLWTKNLISEPMQFEVSKKKVIKTCDWLNQ